MVTLWARYQDWTDGRRATSSEGSTLGEEAGPGWPSSRSRASCVSRSSRSLVARHHAPCPERALRSGWRSPVPPPSRTETLAGVMARSLALPVVAPHLVDVVQAGVGEADALRAV